jgi:aspartate racemase
MKTLGMIGGTSWVSTLDYYRYLNELVAQRVSPAVNPPLLLYSLNASLMRMGDWDAIASDFLKHSKMLEKAGADAIIFCANTTHKVYDQVAPQIGVPILHIADATGRKAKEAGLTKLGLIGTIFTMEDGFIPERLEKKFGIETIVPNKAGRDELHRIVAEEMTQGKFTDSSKKYTLDQLQILKDQGAQAMILGCTEFPILLRGESFSVPLYDTAYLHAELAVDFILG